MKILNKIKTIGRSFKSKLGFGDIEDSGSSEDEHENDGKLCEVKQFQKRQKLRKENETLLKFNLSVMDYLKLWVPFGSAKR
jgi:hypothetical protein